MVESCKANAPLVKGVGCLHGPRDWLHERFTGICKGDVPSRAWIQTLSTV